MSGTREADQNFKSTILINSNNFKSCGCSNHVIATAKLLEETTDDPTTNTTVQNAVDIPHDESLICQLP